MSEVTFAVLLLLVLVWAVTSRVLARHNITGAIVFTVAGLVLAHPRWGLLAVDVETASVHRLAELTLALLLFADAARVRVSQLRRDIALPARLLALGLPLSIALGSLLAALLLEDPLSWALAAFVGATLAPTDAALSAQVINDERIPVRLRRALNVESGLNDGLAAPVVAFTLAVAASQLGTGHGEPAEGRALAELGLGVAVGVLVGIGAAVLIATGARRHWMLAGGRRLATLAAALGSFATALAVDGNGFIAAFVAGITFGAGLPGDVADAEDVAELPELMGEVLALAVWFIFGAALVPVAIDHATWGTVVYALLSLTVVRMVPVFLSLVGGGLDVPTVAFLGWFGPRGLASVVFALLAIEELGQTPALAPAVATVALTVLLSVVAHGVSAGPLGRRYVLVEGGQDDDGAPRSRRLGSRTRPEDDR